MKGLLRMLVMFGPMIFRQYQKWQRNKSNTQAVRQNNRQIEKQHTNEAHIEK